MTISTIVNKEKKKDPFRYSDPEIAKGWHRLSKAVIIQAGKDAIDGDKFARSWLLELDENNPWAALAGIDCKLLRTWAKSIDGGAVLKQRLKRKMGRFLSD